MGTGCVHAVKVNTVDNGGPYVIDLTVRLSEDAVEVLRVILVRYYMLSAVLFTSPLIATRTF